MNFKAFFVLGAVILGGSISYATPRSSAETYITRRSDGSPIAIFTKIYDADLGISWKEPKGRLWSLSVGEFYNRYDMYDPTSKIPHRYGKNGGAEEICKIRGAFLPASGDYYEFLNNNFETQPNYDRWGNYLTEQGIKDLKVIFPDVIDHTIWTGTCRFPGTDCEYFKLYKTGLFYPMDIGNGQDFRSVHCVK